MRCGFCKTRKYIGLRLILLRRLLSWRRPESDRFETKRVSGKMVGKALETICALANAQGGVLVLGVEDAGKGHR